MVINYMSAHDNNTLWDKLLLSNPNDSEEDRNRMNKLGAAILMISQGTPFWQAGEEMLRTKNGVENSYRSSDAVNNIDWSLLKEGTKEHKTMLYYKGLIEMRKAYGIFSRCGAVDATYLGDGAVALKMWDGCGGAAIVLINPCRRDVHYGLDGEWNLVADASKAGTKTIAHVSGGICVEPLSMQVYINDTLAKEYFFR